MRIRKATDYCVLIERVRALDNLPIWEIEQKIRDGTIYSYTDIKSMRKGRKKLLNMVLIATGEREFGGTIDMDVLKLIATGRIMEAKRMSARAFSFWVHVLEDKGIISTRTGFIDEKMIEMIIKKKKMLRKKELATISARSTSVMKTSHRFTYIGH
ncbi:MAG: hypothetical protein OEV21_00520 [Thermoplasmata archaeon]|nr:hypothetical protein [Thermoplasmata archaeon]